MSAIADLRSTVHRVPMTRPWGPDMSHIQVIVCELTTDDGRTGTGFSWAPWVGGRAVHALLETDIRDAAIGLPVHPEVVFDRLWWHLHEAGRGGLTTIALAAVDLALWDLRATGGLVDAIGRRRDTVEVYGSGVNRHYSLDELIAQARRWSEQGHTAVKVKVGRPELAEDVDRIAAVRDVIGPDVRLMIDANQLWDLPRALRAIDALRPYGLHWVEEPMPAEDVTAYARLRASVDVPIALGENTYTSYQFRDLLTSGACDIVQPNVVRVGGITPFLRITELARTFDVPVFPHLLPDISGQLACCLPLPAMVEDVEDASFAALGLLTEPYPVRIEGGLLRPGDHHGLGLRFDPARLAATEIRPAGDH
ncbi:mandelate racemase/muconate lactonizing enzyme family protein [Actinomadura sp. HBU206391]|uniref:mandelate racemase/muconate lactonizing enzyme family protein n=1 Tax=Actinomadura sp. HBU206391 TaxID=2731692 RepID=UPI00164F1C2E|nr:mandelate racemase/muconate lactonizing enzyme family protein [Actinomadura sp. HBU206391]MBC6458222.1 mandelate racemase/muconate lactonizing enzyme family protein [Actinomadura sp. HBU206391]